MPRRGRHRTSVPARLIAVVAALLVTGGVVVAAGSAAADSESGSSGSDSGLFSALSGDDSSDSGSSGESDDGQGQDGSQDGGQDGHRQDDQGHDEGQEGQDQGQGQDGQESQAQQDGQGQQGHDDQAQGQDGRNQDGRNQDGRNQDGRNQDGRNQDGQNQGGRQAQAAADPFPGRDQAAPAGREDYVDIGDVEPNGGNLGDGGRFNGGSYSVDCGVSDHNNSDNYMAAPGKRNGAQHVHDYVGNTTTNANSDDESLDQAQTSCVNGDRSTFFWPVLRDLNGRGPDVGEDGGSRDGNVGRILQPRSAQLTFHGHGDRPVVPLPHHLMMIMGNAKQAAQNGDNVNAKYTCTGHEDRVTDRYPICGAGSRLVRLLDYPSCWDGENLESANFRDHMAFPDEDGNCSDGFRPIPALRITLTYDQPAGRAFSIDSFPNEQHDPRTDHSDFENFSSPASAEAGARCINESQQCSNLPQ